MTAARAPAQSPEQCHVATAGELGDAVRQGVPRIFITADIAGLRRQDLHSGQVLASTTGASLRFAAGEDGVRLSADNGIEGLSLVTDVDRCAVLNDPAVSDLGRLSLVNVAVPGCVRLLTDGAIRAGHIDISGLDIRMADARHFPERPAGFGVEVIPGVLTVWNRQPDPAVRITAELVGISIGRPGAPVRGGGVFVGGAGDGGGRLLVARLETGETHSDGGIATGTPDRISGGVFVVSGTFVDVVRTAGAVTTYGAHDMVLDNWGVVDRWSVEGKLTSFGPSGIGFVNFGELGLLIVSAPIETHGQGARGFNVYDGTVRHADFDRIVTQADGAVGIQLSRPVGDIIVRRGIETHGGIGDSLVRGEVRRLPTTPLSIKFGGSATGIRVAGGIIANGAGVAPIEILGSVDRLDVTGGIVARGEGFAAL